MSAIGIGHQEQANLAWSMSVLELYTPDSIQLLQSIFVSTTQSTTATPTIQLEHAHQLWQALFVLSHDCPDAVLNVPNSLRTFLQDKWTQEKARRKTSSARHRAISQTLDFMRVKHYNEHDEDIDVAIVLKGSKRVQWTHNPQQQDDNDSYNNNKNKESVTLKVAVEFDGPAHFTRESTSVTTTTTKARRPRALGHTVLKYRMLKMQGWTVVRVPYYEFDKIPFWASMERQRYLQRALKTHANIRFSDVDVSEYKPQVHNRKSRFD